jgi:hypothetical protein
MSISSNERSVAAKWIASPAGFTAKPSTAQSA